MPPAPSLFDRIAPESGLSPFRATAFREIWFANLTSAFGSMIQMVAAAWLMTELTSSHLLVALIQASVTMPIMLLGLIAGAVADSYDRRRVMITAQALMLAISAVLAVLAWMNDVTPTVLLLLTLGVGIGSALHAPAWQASVRLQVPPEDLPQAIALNSIAFNIARSVGPARGGLLLALTNVAWAFTVNAVSYLAMIGALVRWGPQATPRRRLKMIPAIGAGIAHCARSSPLRRILLRGFSIGVGIAGYQALVPVLTRSQLHGGEIAFGLLLGGFGIGAICTALVVRKALRRFGAELVVTLGSLAIAAALVALAEVHSVAPAIGLTFLAGSGWTATMTSMNVSMQLRSPEEILGRCMAIFQAMTFGGMALGAWAWGALADAASLTAAILSAAV
ncbi:MAG: MFS transporter, partial [Tsuneonella sp.]